MKTWYKVILIISSVVLGISLLVGGGYLYLKYRYQQEQKYMIQVVYSDEAKEVFNKCLKNMDPKAFTNEGVIQSYEIDKSSIEHNPMGGINVILIINHDKKPDCDLTLCKDSSTGKLEVGSGSYAVELDSLIKENKNDEEKCEEAK